MTNGQSGEYPEYYDVAKAALYWGVDPDEMITKPVYWIEVAAIILTAENAAAERRKTLDKLSGGRGLGGNERSSQSRRSRRG